MNQKKVDCECGHGYDVHSIYGGNKPCYSKEVEAPFPVCPCTKYDPAGHNPEIENIVCPDCAKSWLVSLANSLVYFCYACQNVLLRNKKEK